jgi:hypothetical protein
MVAVVDLSDDEVRIEQLTVRDPLLCSVLRNQTPERRVELVERALSVGARGLMTMGLGVDLAEVDDRVRRSVAEGTADARRQLESILERAVTELSGSFDPEHRTSATARAIAEFGLVRDGLLKAIDPGHRDSVASKFLGELDELLGPAGKLEGVLERSLDPSADGSGFARIAAIFEDKLTELRDLMVRRQGADAEAEKGTRKGFDYEAVIEDRLRVVGRAIGGCVVENTGRTPGELAAGSVVGDVVITLPTMRKVVVEAKNTAKLTLHGPKGILRELDDALTNRGADAAVCVSAATAFPAEVGVFGIYGNRVLVVDDGEGTLLEAAVRVASLLAERTAASGRDAFDPDALARRLANIRELANNLGASRRQLTDVSKSVEMVSVGLGTLRLSLLAMVDEAVADLARPPVADVLDLPRREVV